MKDIKLDFHDLRVQPAKVSDIDHRAEINPYYRIKESPIFLKSPWEYLPIFTAPMDTVVNSKNVFHFIKNKIHVAIPRGEHFGITGGDTWFKGLGLDEFINKFLKVDDMDLFSIKENNRIYYILIDIANGHMKKLHDAIKKAKELYGEQMVIMAGNVANPKTFKILSKAGADYIRIGIGNGNACLTTKQTTVGYPMASLIMECKKVADAMSKPAKIVADGGMKDFSDIILALSLGADYVMVGSLLNKALESCGKTLLWGFIPIKPTSRFAYWAFNKGWKITKKFRGMSTKEVQKKWGNKILKTSEGIVTKRRVEYTLKQWTDNFEDYLRSTMSYSNAKTLEEFIGEAEIIKISDKAYKRFDK